MTSQLRLLVLLAYSLSLLPPSRPDCIVGPDLLPHPLSNVGSYLQIFTSIRFPCSGKVVRWSYYSRAAGTPVYFGVWEAVNATSFRLVDYNRVIPNRTGLLHEDIYDPTEYVSVTPGLYLGIHYDSIDIPQDKQVIPYADAIKPDPYTLIGLSDGFPVGVGHGQIVGASGHISFTGILFKQWRLPALQASVKFLIDCGKPPMIPSSKVTFKTTLAFSTAVYECMSGYRLIGTPISTCQSSGLWSAPPICDINDLCFAGPDLYENPLESASSLLQLFPSLQFNCGGYLGRWWFYSLVRSRIVYLSVWRQVPGSNAVKMVGSNRILSANRGLNYFRVPEEDQIFVDPGDFIGIFYDRPDWPMADVVVPYAADHNLGPYQSTDLKETLLLPMGQVDIAVSNGQIDLTKHADGAIAYWRIPAFRGYVIKRRPSNFPVTDKGVPVCAQPPLVAFATIAFSSTKVGSIAVYSCVQGYTLYGQNPIKCLPTQKWSGAPECRLIPRCDDPPAVPLAVAYYNGTSVGSQVTFFCKGGFILSGPNPITCLTNLTWSQPLPFCQPSSACPPPPVLLNGHLSMTGSLTPKGAVAFYECEQGFVMVGGSSVFCTNDQSWSTPPVCAPALPIPQPGKPGKGGATGPSSWDKLSRPFSKTYTPSMSHSRRTKPPKKSTTAATTTTTGCSSCAGNAETTTQEMTTNFVSFNVPSEETTIEATTEAATEAVTEPQETDCPDYSAESSGTTPSESSQETTTECADEQEPETTGVAENVAGSDGDQTGGQTNSWQTGGQPSTDNLYVYQGQAGQDSGTSAPATRPPGSRRTRRTTTTTMALEPTTQTWSSTDDAVGATDEGIVVLSANKDAPDQVQSIIPAVLVPIAIILLIVIFAIVFAWFRHKKLSNEAVVEGFSTRPYYENVNRNGGGRFSANDGGSVATGYARGSHSDDGYNDAGAANFSTKTEDEMSMGDDILMEPPSNDFKRPPNFFIAGAGQPLSYANQAVPPPPPPPLPPPPAYFHTGTLGTRSVAALSYNNNYYARGGPRSGDPSMVSTLKRKSIDR